MKKSTHKRLTAWLLTLALVVTLLPGMGMTALAAEDGDESTGPPAVEVVAPEDGNSGSDETVGTPPLTEPESKEEDKTTKDDGGSSGSDYDIGDDARPQGRMKAPTALAADNPDPTAVLVDGNKSFLSPSKLYYKNGDSKDSFSGTPTDYNAAYDPSTGTLTLKGYEGGGITLGGASADDLTIKLIDDNTITPYATGIQGNSYNGSITITKDSGSSGTLTINATNSTKSVYVAAGGSNFNAASALVYNASFLIKPVPLSMPQLTVKAPTTSGGMGKIVGTTTQMQYAPKGTTNWKPCSNGETSVMPGTYYLYLKADSTDTNHTDSIYVFDNNPSTNVVCEGYAKAFKHLCDLSSFSESDLLCSLVTGTMTVGTSAGPHMWNIVTFGSRNYLVDVTNCDADTVGAPDKLFLCGAAENEPSKKYTATAGSQSIVYEYDADTLSDYASSDLKLEEMPYSPTSVSGLTVSGTIRSYGSASESITVTLVPIGGSPLVKSVTGSSVNYSFTGVSAGNYTLKVEKKGHAPWTESITVSNQNIYGKDVTVYLWGDVNRDGKVNSTDALWVRQSSAGGRTLDNYQRTLANVNADNKVNSTDALWIRQISAGSRVLNY